MLTLTEPTSFLGTFSTNLQSASATLQTLENTLTDQTATLSSLIASKALVSTVQAQQTAIDATRVLLQQKQSEIQLLNQTKIEAENVVLSNANATAGSGSVTNPFAGVLKVLDLQVHGDQVDIYQL